MNDPISVGLGEIVVSRDANDVFVAYGLGSCVAVGMIDPVYRVCGLVHAVLPERLNGTDPHSPRYVDSGVEGLLHKMVAAGADRRRIEVRMVGGANMLLTTSHSNTFDIGTRNVAAAHQVIKRLNLRLVGEQTGGNTGRTVRVFVGEGKLTYRTIGGVETNL